MRYFNYAGLSPTRVEAVEEMQAVSNEFRALLFSDWHRLVPQTSRELQTEGRSVTSSESWRRRRYSRLRPQCHNRL